MVEGIKKFINIIWDMYNTISHDLEKIRMENRNYKEICIQVQEIGTLSFSLSDSRKYQMVIDGIKEGLKFIVAEYRNNK